jgi:heat-inducible transcriptional repressor
MRGRAGTETLPYGTPAAGAGVEFTARRRAIYNFQLTIFNFINRRQARERFLAFDTRGDRVLKKEYGVRSGARAEAPDQYPLRAGPGRAGAMDLDPRKEVLLQAIVVNYVRLAEPVGSQFLAANEKLGVRSATIRNELAEMTDLGYLRQPHTSAGRIPSDLGYRYYVDRLMSVERLSAGETRALRDVPRISEGDLEQLLVQTCRVLSSLTRYTSVATPPASEEPLIRQVHLAQIAPTRLLAVVVLDSGQVVHRFLESSQALPPAAVTELGNALDAALRDLPVSGVPGAAGAPSELAELEELYDALLVLIGKGVAQEEGELYAEGASHMLEQPEFREANRVEPLIRFLEERRTAYETLRRLVADRNLAVSIGRENPHEAMREVSVVAARYGAGGRMHGWVGVLGPTRMHYDQAASAVRYAAHVLTETLSHLGGD